MTERDDPSLRVAILSALGGLLAVWVPWRLAGSPANMIDGMQPISFPLLVAVGAAAGAVAPRQFWVVGVATMVLFPVIAIIGAVADPTSHNLLGLELLMYGVFSVLPVAGAALGKLLAQRIAG